MFTKLWYISKNSLKHNKLKQILRLTEILFQLQQILQIWVNLFKLWHDAHIKENNANLCKHAKIVPNSTIGSSSNKHLPIY